MATRRGSTYVLCERSATDPRYARYPNLPVVRCAGYDPRTTESSALPRDA
ncbi:MAG TPA: hypothetical protein VFJ80_01950 [Candidatus Limnocylindrales bacterium]|nr:hypothetical protein [Candidatus Limnocylindrales bacterium]